MSKIPLPLAGWPLLLLCGLYLLIGNLGHDPWKPDDVIHVAIARSFVEDGHWLLPRLAGEPWLGMPPLYHWLAALSGKLFSAGLAFHHGARLASALIGGVLFLGLATAGRALKGQRGLTGGAPLLAMGTLGLLVPIHDAQPTLLFVAAQAGLFVGLGWLTTRPLKGALLLAGCIATGLWSIGASAAPFLLIPPLLAPLHPDWRSPRIIAALIPAWVAGIAIAALWPLALWMQSPALFSAWRAGEFAHFANHMNWDDLQDHLELLSWASWPVLPLAGWALWSMRRQWRDAALLFPALGALIGLVIILPLTDPQPLQHLPLLVPLTLLASAGVERLRRGAANAFDWFGMMTFTLIAGLIWLGGISMITGEPVRVARNFTKAEPGFVGEFSWWATASALLLTALWIASLIKLAKSPWRSATHWTLGVMTMWGLVATLWMPWIDYGKTYRPVALSLREALGDSPGCVGRLGVGESQRASLDYFIDLRTQPFTSKSACPWLLTQGPAKTDSVPAGWTKVWEGHRPGDRGERLRLYKRY